MANSFPTDGTPPSWPVEQHRGHQTKCLPRAFLGNGVTNRFRSVSLSESNCETFSEAPPQKMGATFQHGDPQEERLLQIDVIHLFPSALGQRGWHLEPRGPSPPDLRACDHWGNTDIAFSGSCRP